MKKNLKRSLAFMLAMATTLGTLSACGGREGSRDVDNSKTQLNIGVWDGGYRYNWLQTWADQFMRDYANYEFEPGKKGVEVWVNPSKDYINDTIAGTINDYDDDIFFIEQCNYYKFVDNKTALDITDWVTTPIGINGETQSIADKMSAYDKSYFGVDDTSPTYYAVPWYTAFTSISYDVDLFESKNLYFAAEGTNQFISNPMQPKSKGPDGKTGIIDGIDYSADDGLPATYEQFFILCDHMVSNGVTPIVWAGGFLKYMNEFFNALVASANGYDEMVLNYTFDGTSNNLIKSIDEQGNIIYEDPTKIEDANGYLLQKQAGRYYASQFMEKLIQTKGVDGNPKYYNKTVCLGSTSHLGAQSNFLKSRFKTDGTNPVGMFVDGTWWYNEAGTVFNEMGSIQGAGPTERRIGVMPLPKPNETYVENGLGEPVFASSWITEVAVKSSIKESVQDCAELFFKYIHTDKALSEFTRYGNGVRPFAYELSEDDEDFTSYYAKNQLDIMKHAKVVVPYSKSKITLNYASQIHVNYNTIVTNAAGQDKGYDFVVNAFKDGYSAVDFFKGLAKNTNSESWKSYIG